jgi:hypothetical protein
MSETIPSQTPKKTVSRNVAVALGIVCILLIAGLGGGLAYYVSTHTHSNSDYNALITNNANLNNMVSLNSSTVWVNNKTITQAAGNYTSWEFKVLYAGYILIDMEFPTINNNSNTYIRVINSAALLGWLGTYIGPVYGYQYDNQTNAMPGHGWDYTFPVLPTYEYEMYPVSLGTPPNLQIIIGNTNTVYNTTLTVTITYYY